jgi:cytochrome b6-f complex iron-sulfur subunit
MSEPSNPNDSEPKPAPAAAPASPAGAPAPAARPAAPLPAAVTPKPAAAPPAAAKPAAKPAAGGDMTRRGFFSWLGIAWLAFTGASAISLAQLGRFMFPGIVVEPPLSFKAGFPQDYGPGVDERWKEKYGVWIVRDEGQMYALIAICTHLGCPPNWLPAEEKFKCPCHGSGYYINGVNFEGPTPRPLERAAISISEDGQILVDKGRVFQYEKGQWTDPAAFLKA